MSERERFEAWARQRWTHPEDFDQRIKAPSKYNNYEVQAAWEAWQERAAQPALTPSAGAESRGCGSCKHWINERRSGDKEGSGSCDRVPMQWQAEPDDALAFVTDGELYFAQLRTMPSFFCAHFEAVTPSAENSSTSPVERAAGPTASDLP